MSNELPIEQGGEEFNHQFSDQEDRQKKESFSETLAKSGIIIFGTFGVINVATGVESGNDEDYFKENFVQTSEVVEIQEIEHTEYVQDSFLGLSFLGISLLSCVALVRIRRKNRDTK
jgi:hypothetical protein